MEKSPTRKLAVILHADVVGSTALVKKDEVLAHERIRNAFAQFSGFIEKYNGAAHEIRGDALVAEFGRVSDAICAALGFQDNNKTCNDELDDPVKPSLRVGIAMGEVVIADDTVTGEGVILAQRLEQLAEEGGVCIQGAAYDTVPKRLPFQYSNLGEHKLKGFDEPVRAYSVSLVDEAMVPEPEGVSKSKSIKLDIPDKPSIAVLPFDNMSGDPEQEYFSDGITEDIITALSRFRWFHVIARNSTFVYKGKATGIPQIGEELGVHYVLEGSVRRSGERIRITAQLIETDSGNHVWAERYDRELRDIFDLQDEITATIAAAVEPELAGSERLRVQRKPTENLGAMDLFHKGVTEIWQQDKESIQNGCQYLHRAIQLDPAFGQAYGYLAFCAFMLLVFEWTDDPETELKTGLKNALEAVKIDQRDYFAYHALGRLYTIAGDIPSAIRALKTCLETNPYFALGYLGLGEAEVYGGNPDKAIEYLDKAIQLSPNDPMKCDMYHYKASAMLKKNNLKDAIENFERACEFPTTQYVSHATLAACYALDGQEKNAERALENSLSLDPNVSIERMKAIYGPSSERSGSRSNRLIEALRKTGLKES